MINEKEKDDTCLLEYPDKSIKRVCQNKAGIEFVVVRTLSARAAHGIRHTPKI